MDLNKNESTLDITESVEKSSSTFVPEIAPKQSMLHKVGAALVFLISFVAFFTTVAPTVSFWDCGEYIASCYTLGIPHPPGNPMFVLLGRIFTILIPWTEQVAFRVNMISVLSGSLTAFFLYLIIGRGLRTIIKDLAEKDQAVITTVAGFVGALFGVFNYTFWFSSVEASVYVPSVLVVVMNVYIALVWAQSQDENRDRYLLLFAYLAFLGIGIHMFSMLALLPVFIYIILVEKEKLKDWRLWIVAILMASVIYSVASFIYIAPMLLVITGLFAYTPQKLVKGVVGAVAAVALGLLIIFGLGAAEGLEGEAKSAFVRTLLKLFLALGSFTFYGVTKLAESSSAQTKWKLPFYIVVFALLGYSVHAYIPIRSSLEPMIDENHPVVEWKNGKVEWTAFKHFLERKQYGSESMLTRMLHRRGNMATQFGIDGHMGYGGFHLTQFFHFGESIASDRDHSDESTINNTKLGKARAYKQALKKDKRLTPVQRDERYQQYLEQNDINVGGLFLQKLINLLLYLIPTMVVLWAMGFWIKRDFNKTILFAVLFFTTSVGMVLAMNFADGTRPEKADYQRWKMQSKQALKAGRPAPAQPRPVHREVRIRDYFFTAGFAFFGMWIGLAAGAILYILYSSGSVFFRKKLAPVAIGLFMASPALPVIENYHENDRTNDWIPYDYAYNLLMSCTEGGILFTNGDNDTFPLWFLQEAEGIRRDVRVVNLSLLNTRWYIKQLKKLDPKVPISYSYDYIADEGRLNHGYNPITGDDEVELPQSKLPVRLPNRERKQFFRIQDIMVINIVDANFALPKEQQKPIYFSVTVSPDNLMGLDPYLRTEGMVYRVGDRKIPDSKRMNFERTKHLLDKVYNFRNLGDNSTPLSRTARNIMGNYSAAFLHYAFNLRMPVAQAKGRIEQIDAILVQDSLQTANATDTTTLPSLDRSALSSEKDSLQTYYNESVEEIINKMDRCVSIIPWDYRSRRYRHQFLMEFGKYELAIKRLEEALLVEPKHKEYNELLKEAKKVLEEKS